MSHVDRGLALAEHYLDVGRPGDALRALRERGAPADERTWVALADALRRLDRFEEALEATRDGLAESPQSTTLLELLCICETELGDVAAAERAVREALALDPESAHMLCRYGHLLARWGRVDEAREVAALVERADPGGADSIRLRLAVGYVVHGREAGARESRELLQLEPEDAGAHRSLAVHAAARGDVVAATRHMEEVVRQDPTDAEAVEVARDFRIASHPLMAPLWPFRRFGPWKVLAAVWIGVAAVAAVSPTVAGMLLLGYAGLVVYSWLVPPLVRRRSR